MNRFATVRKGVVWFLLGGLCFTISQPLLRLPLLDYLQQSGDFLLTATLYPMMTGVGIAFSAGVFEEGFRFIFKSTLLRSPACPFSQPLLFGLGHGVTEAAIVLIPALLAGRGIPLLGVALLERALAIGLHIHLTVLVWNGVVRNKKVRYLLAAIAIHGTVNAAIPLFASHPNGVWIIESVLAVVVLVMSVHTIYSKRFYTLTGGEQHVEKQE